MIKIKNNDNTRSNTNKADPNLCDTFSYRQSSLFDLPLTHDDLQKRAKSR